MTRIDDIKRYLLLKGWKHDSGYPNRDFIALSNHLEEVDDRFLALIPMNPNAKDFPTRVYQIVEMLSGFEERTFEDILYEITNPYVDRLYIRISSSLSERGSVPLTFANKFIKSIKDLITASICNEMDPQPFHDNTRVASDATALFRLGHTSPGSFVFLIEAPNNETDYFNRTVLEGICGGIRRLAKVQTHHDVDIRSLCSNGLSFNMAKAITDQLYKGTSMNVEYNFRWFSLDNSIKEDRVLLDTEVLEHIKHAIVGVNKLPAHRKYLLLRQEQSELGPNAQGPVSNLPDRDQEQAVDDNKTTRFIEGNLRVAASYTRDEEVTIHGIIIELSSRHGRTAIIDFGNGNAIVYLDNQNYRLACDAYRDMKEVRVSGKMERNGSQLVVHKVQTLDLS